ncbi:uncharacterized protein PGTG_01249 [Puccinia graminis f. sp. tritici CRL 75-36-700-3]|uniref:Uncharacterized protein n=1 Tax=Puccinia graminis f. sp. tritici (strain CRL 75-36-700-3 / race SCCL) TaxID=418459 RepID=E3JV43_PUCGT|nr:uncharacterized protein PGTG_01249 [Puccinia graminis f. sp. tritici CRL 75-36-700-3]EFP75918.1 hypothetical protein PGTG_01249 [Puccinia graminis f. sp. tritici CRL 75-36-700-3]
MYLVPNGEESKSSRLKLLNNGPAKSFESSPSDSGWGTGSEGDAHDPHKIGKEKTESLLGKADSIIDQIGGILKISFDRNRNHPGVVVLTLDYASSGLESWESEFFAQVEPIKEDFKKLAHRVRNLMLTEASISQNLSNLVEASHSNDRELRNEITGNFGETLEQAVKMNKKDEFIDDLASLKAKNVEEMDNFKEDLARETASFPGKIQTAKSTKAEQKQVQLKLAKILADGLP